MLTLRNGSLKAAEGESNVDSNCGGGSLSETISNIIEKVQQEFHGFYFRDELKVPGKSPWTQFIFAPNCPYIECNLLHLFGGLYCTVQYMKLPNLLCL